LTLKIDQPEVELILDRDKVAALGLDMATVGSDLAALVGGNYVNRFDFAGRSYKVIPQLKRIERLTAGQLENNYVQGPNGKLIPVSTFAHAAKENHAARAQPVSTAQLGLHQRRGHPPAG
jgi:multidrug efflux pump